MNTGTPQFITGAGNLLTDGLTWILYLVPLACGLMVAYHAFAKAMSEGDPAVVSTKNKSIKNVLICGAIAESAAGLVTLFLGYFK